MDASAATDGRAVASRPSTMTGRPVAQPVPPCRTGQPPRQRDAAWILSLAAGLLWCAGASAARVSVPEAQITFEVPDGFTALSREEIAVKFPHERAPAYVVGNAGRTTTIAFELKQDRLAPGQLPDIKRAFEELLPRVVPGLEWKERRLVQIGGQPWVQLEMSSYAVDTDIRNIMLISSRFGRMLIVNFNSTKADFASMEAPLRGSIQTIVLGRAAAGR